MERAMVAYGNRFAWIGVSKSQGVFTNKTVQFQQRVRLVARGNVDGCERLFEWVNQDRFHSEKEAGARASLSGLFESAPVSATK